MRNVKHNQTRTRKGFTLVELLVAAALTMLIMTILASTFQTAMDSLSHLRSAGELQDRLRSSTERLRQDLQAPHHDDEAIGSGKVSNLRLDLNPSGIPRSGFFQIVQTTASTEENSSSAANPKDYSTGATTHGLMMTVKLPGKTRQSIFTAPRVGTVAGVQGLDDKNDNLIQNTPSTYASKWAIVSWFLSDSGEKTNGPSPQTLFSLRRRVKLLAEVPDSFIDPASADAVHYFFDNRPTIQLFNTTTSTYDPAIANPNYGRVFTPKDRVVWDAALASDTSVTPQPTRPTDMFTPLADGSDIVMSNVLSFEVKADYTPVLVTTSGPVTTLYPRPAVNPATLPPAMGVSTIAANGFNQDYPFDDLPKNPSAPPATPNLRKFDTGLFGGTGLSSQNIRIKSTQFKLRIYDPKNKTTRQQTIVQEM